MSEAVELARNLSFVEASARCKENTSLVLRRTEDGSGFSVWGKKPASQGSTTEGEPDVDSTRPVETARTDAKPDIQYKPVQCYKCSGRGSSLSGNICTLCEGTGRLKYQPPAIPQSVEGRPPVQPAALSQVEIKKLLLARSNAPPIPSASADRWKFCHQCGGDGGAGGRCPRCGGNGFEP